MKCKNCEREIVSLEPGHYRHILTVGERPVPGYSCMNPEPELCRHCGGPIAIRNPTGKCDHLYYPESCKICKNWDNPKKAKKEITCDKCGIVRSDKKGWITAIGAVNRTKYTIHLCPEHAMELV